MLRRAVVVSTLILTVVGACRGDDGKDPTDPDPVDPGTEVIQCADPVAPPTSGICDIDVTSGTKIAIRGDVLAPDAVYADGTVVVDGDEITCVGCDCDTSGASVVSCAGAAISPGLINPHDHLRFTEGAPIDHGATRYDHRHGWRGSLSSPQNPNGTGQNSAGMRWGELRMALSGVTSMVGSGRAQYLIRNLDDLVDEEVARGLSEVEFQTFSLGDAGEDFRADCGWNYKFTELEASEFDAFLPHVAEGIDNFAAEEFRCQSTSFDNGQDFTESNATHIHSIGLSATDYLKMASDGTRLLWSPRSNISLYGHTAQVTTFHRLGGTLALGTDWTYSGSANQLRELACADEYNRDYLDGYFTDMQLWEMATINAAVATDNETLLGSLETGKIADIAVFAARDAEHHRAVLEADNADVALVLLGGRPLLGETHLVSGLGDTCDPVDVCGDTRAICASREFSGSTFASIQTEVGGAYPAVFCGVPANEPTCVPSRPGEFSGALTADDSDGDGIADAQDNCPSVFNATRPIDGGAQPDSDGDGIGDPCDDAPLLADIDADGIDNDADNCPFTANAGQADGDSDGRGNDCDFCPDVGNPMGVCPQVAAIEASVPDIQTGAVAEGTRVTVTDLVVTGVWGSGVWAQDPTAGGTHSGIHVFTGSTPTVVIGDVIDATGEVIEFFDDTEIASATITSKGSGSPIAPTPITVAEAMDEAYEGVLVTLTDAETMVSPYDCSADNSSCADQNLWEINGSVLVFDRLYEDADWASQMALSPVTGVMNYRFDRRRIMPRVSADIGN